MTRANFAHLRLKGCELLGLFSKKNSAGTKISAAAVQTGSFTRHPFGRVGLFTPMGTGGRVYASLRESVPIIDAAVLKIIRLVNDFKFATGDDAVDRDLNGFFESINVRESNRNRRICFCLFI